MILFAGLWHGFSIMVPLFHFHLIEVQKKEIIILLLAK